MDEVVDLTFKSRRQSDQRLNARILPAVLDERHHRLRYAGFLCKLGSGHIQLLSSDADVIRDRHTTHAALTSSISHMRRVQNRF